MEYLKDLQLFRLKAISYYSIFDSIDLTPFIIHFLNLHLQIIISIILKS